MNGAMDVYRSLDEARAAGRLRGCAVAIGNFDGVHLGHQRLLALARELAHARGAAAAVLTFEPHPVRVLRPKLAPPLLATLPRKLELLAGAGADATVVQPFDLGYAATAAEAFVARDLAGALGCEDVVVGYDFTAGHERARVDALRPLLAAHGDPAARRRAGDRRRPRRLVHEDPRVPARGERRGGRAAPHPAARRGRRRRARRRARPRVRVRDRERADGGAAARERGVRHPRRAGRPRRPGRPRGRDAPRRCVQRRHEAHRRGERRRRRRGAPLRLRGPGSLRRADPRGVRRAPARRAALPDARRAAGADRGGRGARSRGPRARRRCRAGSAICSMVSRTCVRSLP